MHSHDKGVLISAHGNCSEQDPGWRNPAAEVMLRVHCKERGEGEHCCVLWNFDRWKCDVCVYVRVGG